MSRKRLLEEQECSWDRQEKAARKEGNPVGKAGKGC
jgi:hypothetical protein